MKEIALMSYPYHHYKKANNDSIESQYIGETLETLFQAVTS